MARNTRRFTCPPEAVFAVLADGWLYPGWVVGASRMRRVDGAWPQPGSELHHSFGTWPVLLDDRTVVEEWSPPRRMVLLARGWPMGEARVEIEAQKRDAGCVIRMRETAVSGPASWLGFVLEPLLLWRNRETLHRLALLAEGSARRPPSNESAPTAAP